MTIPLPCDVLPEWLEWTLCILYIVLALFIGQWFVERMEKQ